MKIVLPTLHVRPSAQATPLAAACLKATLPETFRHQAELLDLYPTQIQEEMLELILKMQPDVVAFPLYLWNRQRILNLTRELRRLKPEIILVAGGPEASADSCAVLAEGHLDAVIRGEGEEVFVSLINTLAKGETIDEIPGAYTVNSQRPMSAYCEDLSTLPSPYLSGTLVPEAGDGLLWEVARGCPFDCAFCYDAKGQQGVRPLPMERLEEELRLFVANGVEQIWVLDSTFNFPAERGHKLLELLLKTAPEIHYHLEAKADFLDKETVRLLSQLQCSVQIGLQSADPQVLKPLHRSFDPARLFKRLQMLSEAGIVFGLDLIYGLPGDNHQGFRASLDAALNCGPNQLDMFPLAVLPGTQLHQDKEKLGLEVLKESPYEILSGPGYSADELAKSRLLAAATDIFYNRGRAVGFLAPICRTLNVHPSELLDQFSGWMTEEKCLAPDKVLAVEDWQPEDILPLQLDFLAAAFQEQDKSHLLPLLSDLIQYHYNYAETLLAQELLPSQGIRIDADAWHRRWERSKQLRLVDFNYELDELMEMGGLELKDLYKALAPNGSTGIFLRRGQEVICESLQDDFARLLKGSIGQATPAEILPEYAPDEGMEILEFALREGLLTE